MLRRILILIVMLIAVLSLSFAPGTHSTAAGYDCPIIRTVCWDMWMDGMQSLCNSNTNKTAEQCLAEAVAGYDNCVISSSEGQCTPTNH